MDKNLARIRHERSRKDFPKLQLNDDEYIEFAFGRARNSLLFSWGIIAAITAVVLLAVLLLVTSEIFADDTDFGFLLTLLLALALADLAAGWSVSVIHRGNKIFFTNQRLIQTIVNIPLFEDTRSVNLEGIHNVEFQQNNIVERILGYGNLKISTHEKNVMVLENMEMKSAMQVFNDNTGSVYVFKDLSITNQELNEINELISKAPKIGHKEVEDVKGLNPDL